MKATDCIGDHADFKRKEERKQETYYTPHSLLSRGKAIHIGDNNQKKVHFMALPHDMCTSTLKVVTPTSLFGDGLGDNEDSVWMGFLRS